MLILTALCLAALVVAPAAAAPVVADYAGTTSQGKDVSFQLHKDGSARTLKSFRIKWTATCPGTDLTFHGSARLQTVGFVGGRFAGAERGVKSPAGGTRIATTSVALRGFFAKGGQHAQGHWRAKTAITTRKGKPVARCRSGLLHWTATRAPEDDS